ncbi:hypothetical protein FOPG_19217 [Fusarium oxysporum f. sp. conglutinans race 2 54008]|uniref:Uncharacterized protein n=1 Tax=Fusarium oxysporum f. sp. conglutinans race 2 54008 TaxID=1089457 RepID=X0GLM7_FUSOX|nr:hypothetical protein FOPG_19217 [Fusarium oxysporum f. sp. conglutinans race 2 54008]
MLKIAGFSRNGRSVPRHRCRRQGNVQLAALAPNIQELGLLWSRPALDQREAWLWEVDITAIRSGPCHGNTQHRRGSLNPLILLPRSWY